MSKNINVRGYCHKCGSSNVVLDADKKCNYCKGLQKKLV
jgi:hypothetical protein